MGDKTYMLPPIGGKSILRSTGEEVEIIDFELKFVVIELMKIG